MDVELWSLYDMGYRHNETSTFWESRVKKGGIYHGKRSINPCISFPNSNRIKKGPKIGPKSLS